MAMSAFHLNHAMHVLQYIANYHMARKFYMNKILQFASSKSFKLKVDRAQFHVRCHGNIWQTML